MPNYQFPSSQTFSMTEIEGRTLRRKKTEKYLPVSLLEIAIVTILSGLSIGLVVSIILLSV